MKIIASIILVFSYSISMSMAQKTIVDVVLRDLKNKPVMSADIIEKGKPALLVFWATWCSHTKDGLTEINDDYLADWQDEFDLQLVAVSVDDARNLQKVRPYVNGQGWEFDVYTDANGDFKRAMNVNNAPFFMLIDQDGNVVWNHNSYAPGDAENIGEELQKLNQ